MGHVAVGLLVQVEGRVFGVEAALHAVSNDERTAARAVVAAAAVVPYAPSELGEHEHHNIVGSVVIPDVLEEVHYRAGKLGEQPGVSRHFVGVGVVAAVLGVDDSRSEVGEMHARGVAEATGYRVAGVLDVGGVRLGHLLEYVRALENVETGAGDVLPRGAASDGLSVHLLEYVERLLTLFIAGDAGHNSVVVQIADGGNRDALFGHGAG